VSLHGMWLFLWDENSSTYRFPPLEQENVEEMVGELVRFGDGVKYKQEVQNEVKSLIPGYALSPGQGSVGLSLRIGNECTVCIRNTILMPEGLLLSRTMFCATYLIAGSLSQKKVLQRMLLDTK
jgi:hypothetical protein